MNCQALAHLLSFDCVPVSTRHGETAFELGTPFSYADGSAVVFYAIERADTIELSDNGETLMHLSGAGLDAFNPRKLSAVRNEVVPYNLVLTEQGEIHSVGRKEHAGWLVSQFISGVLAVARLERQLMGVPEEIRQLADEVEMYLRAWKPTVTLARHAKLRGISGHEYQFDFMQGEELIDAISPHHSSVGGLMRKLGDVLNGPHDKPPTIRIIVDDRSDPERAHKEIQIIGSLAKSMPLTKLIEKVPGGLEIPH